ncbi:MAG: ferredoxin [Thermodesulfovibrio sp.]|nr:ferredoxin [Thermodesulfovibrio sp.]
MRDTVRNRYAQPWRPLSPDDYTPLIHTGPGPAYDALQRGRACGAAVDLGTSQIRISTWDRRTGERLAGICGMNPQAVFGTDILMRLTAACRSEERAREISRMAGNAIGDALRLLASRGSAGTGDIGQIMIVGNTAMLSLLSLKNYSLLLQPEYWSREIDCRPEDTRQWHTDWGLANDAAIDIIQPLGGFVGSDLLAGVLATNLTCPAGDAAEGALFIDFGSNSEIALWDGAKLWVTSAAGGPAFEGRGITCGMPAGPGAIYRITPGHSPHDFAFDVIGGEELQGLCGSGLVDGIACLLKLGILKKNGNFSPGIGKDGFSLFRGREDIVLKKKDVDSMQRAKAAIGAGVFCLLENAGMRLRDLRRVCIAGAFGKHLNIANACSIGLIPDVSPAKIELYGNAALAGCELLLIAGEGAETLAPLRSSAHMINLSGDSLFEDKFIQNLYLQPMQTA